MNDDQLRHLFGFKPPTEAQAKAIVRLRTTFYALGQQVIADSVPGRAQALALTALQKACWASVAAVVDATE